VNSLAHVVQSIDKPWLFNTKQYQTCAISFTSPHTETLTPSESKLLCKKRKATFNCLFHSYIRRSEPQFCGVRVRFTIRKISAFIGGWIRTSIILFW